MKDAKKKPISWGTVMKFTVLTLVILCLIGTAAIYSVYNGIILLNNPSQSTYPIRGVDVSHYQGDIDWKVLSSENIQFAYIKATEGSSHIDKRFLENWEAARRTDLAVGAYHFFSFDSPGENQLTHFTQVVPAFEEMLPPVVDFEFYGDKKVNPPDVETTIEQLTVMLTGLEEYYGVCPIIYATEDSWELYLKGRFDEYPLWIRNVITRPKTGDQEWLIWQYTNREKLKGYQGEEKYIDMNVFAGDVEEWKLWSR